MADIKILPVFLPTTVVMVDDNVNTLTSVASSLNKEYAVMKLIPDPIKACEFFENDYHIHTVIEETIVPAENEFISSGNLSMELPRLDTEIYNPRRFDRISVIIVNLFMSRMNGIELYKRLSPIIKKNKIKTILLTETPDVAQANQLINAGIIHGYISKFESNFTDKLNAMIMQLQKQYFQELLGIVIARLDRQPLNSPYAYLYDVGFALHFETLCKKNDIAEHFICDNGRSILLVSFEGQPSLLHILNQEDMDGQIYEMKLQVKQPVDEIRKAIENYKVIVYAVHDPSVFDHPNRWEMWRNLFDANKVQGERDTYYYTYINNANIIMINTNAVISYRAYHERLF